ncbi:MAG TPA: hypothetical protein VH619_13555 [Verrucomicrobiae bacterium]|jgi:hypothetical protein|nr:hypothetical protein [Verrucomicrobiae bacterium]
MKRTRRSKRIKLFLIGGISAGAIAGCSPSGPSSISANNVYTNNYYLPGAGYYHAPFRAFYPIPYNYFDSKTHRYFFGGQWAYAPCESITNISSPTPSAASTAQSVRTDVSRGGFGCTGGHYYGHA